MRESLGSRLGFLMMAAGSAVGLGNVWRFPYMAGKNGGAAFVLVYLVFLVMLGFPLLVAELAVGRKAKRTLPEAMRTLAPPRLAAFWRFAGAFFSFGCFVVMIYYTDITGWLVKYSTDYLLGAPPQDPSAAFKALVSDGATCTVFMCATVGFAAAACFAGVAKGVERATKWMMLCLLALIVLLAAHCASLPGAAEGLSFYLKPDWGAFMRNPGGAVIDAMGQAFFTLSIGIGSMTVCGSYIGEDHSLAKEAAIIIVIDTIVALLAGVTVFAACSAYGIEYASGPGLVFEALPRVFAQMPGGVVWGALFFVFLSFAALTTVIAVLEGIVACICDSLGAKRRTAVAAAAAAIAVCSLPCIFIDGVLGWEDFAVSLVWLPAGAFAHAIFVTNSKIGWGWKKFREAASAGRGWSVPDWARPLYAYVIPVLIIFIFLCTFA